MGNIASLVFFLCRCEIWSSGYGVEYIEYNGKSMKQGQRSVYSLASHHTRNSTEKMRQEQGEYALVSSSVHKTRNSLLA